MALADATADRSRTGGAGAIDSRRDLRVDFLRGLFILYLCCSHFTWFAEMAGYGSPLRFYGLNTFGFASPAEFFVFFAGYVLALVLARNFDRIGFWLTQARTIERSWHIYILNLFVFAIVAACSGFLFAPGSALYTVSGIGRLIENPAAFLGHIVLFRDNLAFFEILRNYVFFIPFMPLFLLALRLGRLFPLGVSFLLWACHQIGWTPDLGYPTFNPFAWQLLFFLGATIAVYRPLPEWQFPNKGRQIALCLALLAGAFALRVFAFADYSGDYIPGATKTDVGPLRLIHFALVLWGAMLIVPSSAILERFRLVRGVIAVGQQSLECFCLSNVLVYLGAHLMGYAPAVPALYWGILLALVGIELVAARVFAWFKSEPWRKAAA